MKLEPVYHYNEHGMTPLDEFAKAALPEAMKQPMTQGRPSAVAEMAYAYAEAMMAEKKKREAA